MVYETSRLPNETEAGGKNCGIAVSLPKPGHLTLARFQHRLTLDLRDFRGLEHIT